MWSITDHSLYRPLLYRAESQVWRDSIVSYCYYLDDTWKKSLYGRKNMPDGYGAPPWEVRNLKAEVDTVQKKHRVSF